MKPLELPSNRRVPRLNANSISGIEPPKQSRDPRYTNKPISSREKTTFFTAYKFIYDKHREYIDTLKNRMKKTKDSMIKTELENEIQKLQDRICKYEREKENSELIQEYIANEKKQVAQGKKPYYLKRSAIKQLGLAKKFLQHDKNGNLEKFIEKKRKRRASKDRRNLPST